MSPGYQLASTKPVESVAIPVPVAREVDPQRRRPRWLIVAAGLVLMLLVRGLFVQSFTIASGSMEPTLQPGDHILVNKVAVGSSLNRGDVVVFDGTKTFARRGSDGNGQSSGVGEVPGAMATLLSIQTSGSHYVKRVVGLPGDHVVCCDPDGFLIVNEVRFDEPYLYPGDKASDLTFDVTVPPERLWLMGDHRSDSADSRAHLGDPGGGMVRLDDVIGRAAMVYWPPSRTSMMSAPHALDGIPADAMAEVDR